MTIPFELTETARWLIVLWVTLLGAVVGSFLNVVIYRLPLGENLSYPGSHCPKCGHAIRWFDNIPLLGWLSLKGKCRDCQTAISARYPIVEGVVMAFFTLIAILEIGMQGINLPLPPVVPENDLFFEFLPDSDLILLTTTHLFLLSTLFCAMMIDYDEQSIPLRLFFPGIIISFLAPFGMSNAAPIGSAGAISLDNCLIGAGAGLLFASISSFWLSGEKKIWQAASALIGLTLGILPALAVLLATFFFAITFSQNKKRKKNSLYFSLFFSTFVAIVLLLSYIPIDSYPSS